MRQEVPLKKIGAFGYKVSEKPSNNIESLLLLEDSIPINIMLFETMPQNITLQVAIKKSEEFMKSHFKLHDIDYAIKNCNDQIISTSLINPYQIPIEETTDHISTLESCYIKDCNEYPKKFHVKIRINRKITEFTPSTITHEITHTQQESKEGILNYYTNSEVLTIFLEILHYIEKSSQSERAILSKIQTLANDIYSLKVLLNKKSHPDKVPLIFVEPADVLEANIIETNTYIESTLKALNLIDIYINSNENIKKEIINYIQNIFDANRSVEDFLEYYDTTFESSLNTLQKKIKHIKI